MISVPENVTAPLRGLTKVTVCQYPTIGGDYRCASNAPAPLRGLAKVTVCPHPTIGGDYTRGGSPLRHIISLS